MASALANIDELGSRGEFWTSTASYHCGLKAIFSCWETVSTNNAYVRYYAVTSKESKFFSFLVAGLSAQERSRYQFLWQ